MEARLNVQEWNAVDLTAIQITDVRATINRLKTELRPRLDLAELNNSQLTIRNLIGSARMPSGTVLTVEPKVPTGTNWADAVVQLLNSETRIAVTGSQRSKQSARRDDLSTAIAFEYARRLEEALRHEGPIQVYEHHAQRSRRLNGRLDVSKWVRSTILKPTEFPIERDELTAGNDFARGMSLVAGLFRRSALDGRLSLRLRSLETAILPGHPLPSFVNPAVTSRILPPQWAKYRPAWDIASAVLRNRSIIGDPGHATGLEVSVEPWPLLETLLERSLQELAKGSNEEGYSFIPKSKWPILTQNSKIHAEVEPDGLLYKDGMVAASFEAKYTRPGSVPHRSHTFQALATAAALSSPLAILVYPGEQPLQIFDVQGITNGAPKKLATLGLSMFSYSRGGGDNLRARIIEQALVTKIDH